MRDGRTFFPMSGATLQERRTASAALPPVTVTSQVIGTCLPTATGSAEAINSSKNSLRPLPPLSPAARGPAPEAAAAPAPAAALRHGSIIHHLETVKQQHDERERVVVEMQHAEQAAAPVQEAIAAGSTTSPDKSRRRSKSKNVDKNSIADVATSGAMGDSAAVQGHQALRPPDGEAERPLCGASSEATFCATSPDVNHSIHMLEACNWRVILEYGALGEVVSLAAFAPGVSESTPNTPVTPSAMAAACSDAFDLQSRRPPRSAVESWHHSDPPASADEAGSQDWVNGTPMRRPPTLRLLHPAGSIACAPPLPCRSAWPSETRSPQTPPESRALPLRRGAPASLWSLMHAFGLREYDLSGRKRDVAVILASALLLLVIISQIGVALLHWADVLPVAVAVMLFSAILGAWLTMAAFLQVGHLRPLFTSSGTSAMLKQPPDATVDLGGLAMGRRGHGRARNQRLTTVDAMIERAQGNSMPQHCRAVDESLGVPAELQAPPIAMTAPFLRAVRRKVRGCVCMLLLTAGVIYAFEWYWVTELRPHLLVNEGSLSHGHDGNLWLLAVSPGADLSAGAFVGWGVLSLISSVILAGALWAPICCVACVVEAHVHLAGQLRDTLSDPGVSEGWAIAMLASANTSHGWLARQTSRRLTWFNGFYFASFGYVAVGSMLETALHGVRPAPVCAAVVGLAAVLLLLSCLGNGNARRGRNLSGAASDQLRLQLRREVSQVTHTAVGALAVVRSEQVAAPMLNVLGINVSPQAAPVGLFASAVLLAVSIQVGAG